MWKKIALFGSGLALGVLGTALFREYSAQKNSETEAERETWDGVWKARLRDDTEEGVSEDSAEDASEDSFSEEASEQQPDPALEGRPAAAAAL